MTHSQSLPRSIHNESIQIKLYNLHDIRETELLVFFLKYSLHKAERAH